MSQLRSYKQAYRDIVGQKTEAEADPDCIYAAKVVAALSLGFKKAGWTVRPWRPGPRGPLAHRIVNDYYSYWDWDKSTHYPWFDHPYRLVHKAKAIELFCLEPYDIYEDGVAALAKLHGAGWDVSISAQGALHFPGSTMRIAIRKRAIASPVEE